MNITDLGLLRAVAGNPDEQMRQMLSPLVGYEEAWIQSPAVKKAFHYMAKTILSGQKISPHMVLAYLLTSPAEKEVLSAAWKDGQANSYELMSAIAEAKAEYIVRSGEESIQDYRKRVAEDKSRVREYLSTLGLNISMLAHEGIAYSPIPSSHSRDKDLVRNGTWGDKVLNEMFSENSGDVGGRPSFGFIIASCPTGTGKTTLAVTMLAYTIAFSGDHAVAMSNEAPRSKYSKGVFRALNVLYNGEEYEESIWRKIDSQLAVYAPGTDEEGKSNGFTVKKFETMRQILFWEKPQFAVMDSLNGVEFPAFSKAKDQNQLHVEKADAFRDTCMEYNTLMYAPGNMSAENQAQLVNNPDKQNSVVLFGSKAYENASDYSFLGWQPPEVLGVQNWKRCKNRWGTSRLEQWQMNYDYQGGFYRMRA